MAALALLLAVATPPPVVVGPSSRASEVLRACSHTALYRDVVSRLAELPTFFSGYGDASAPTLGVAASLDLQPTHGLLGEGSCLLRAVVDDVGAHIAQAMALPYPLSAFVTAAEQPDLLAAVEH
eukprot:2937344-Prymnesium_polylepis.1